MGRSTSGTDAYGDGNDAEVPEHAVTIASFSLDTFEVTVGRFRQFVEQYDGTPPPDGTAAHPLISGSGWNSAWNSELPSSKTILINNLKSQFGATWTDSIGENETSPINCVSWYEAFAFCAWDGGRLPTEAEWEYASAGGNENRLYPWGQEEPDFYTHALFCELGGWCDPFTDVGSRPAGAGRWGHHDLAGSMWEWSLDWLDTSWFGGNGASCIDCANLNTASERVVRGGSWNSAASDLRAAFRPNSVEGPPSSHYFTFGIRCARTP